MLRYYQPYWAESESIEHYGVKGMKWGVRRYQNPDGTLTEAGKKARKRATNQFRSLRDKSIRASTRSKKAYERVDEFLPYDREITKEMEEKAREYARKGGKYSDLASSYMETGTDIIKKMQKDFGDVAFDDMDNLLRTDAKNFLYIDELMDKNKYTRRINKK